MEKAIGLNYEQLLAMVSACQWIPERRCVRLALESGNDALAGNPIFDCLNRFSSVIERQGMQNPLSGRTVQLLLSKSAIHYELLQRVDGDSVVTMVSRLVKNIGVNLVLIGFGNGYATALALVLRIRYPQEFNRFCDFAERQPWKIDLDSRSQTEVGGTAGAVDEAQGVTARESEMVRGEVEGSALLAETAHNEYRELAEEDEEEIANEPHSTTVPDTRGKSNQWRFRRLRLR